MNLRLPWTRPTLTNRDREILAEIEEVLSGAATPESETGPLGLFAARMAAATPQPNPAFSGRVAGSLETQARWRSEPSKQGWHARRTVLVVGAACALALGTGAGLYALGDNPPRRVAPREVVSLELPSGVPTVIVAPDTGWTDPTELSKRLGLAVYVPDYLPPNCEPLRSWAWLPPLPHIGVLQYTCVGVTIYGNNLLHRPQVAAGSVEQLAIGGRPATLVKGGWSTDASGNPVWSERPTQLLIEYEDVIVGLRSVGNTSVEELIRIAESLRPVSAK